MKYTKLALVLLMSSWSALALAEAGNPVAELTITDKKAVENWTALTYGKDPSPGDPVGDTQLLVTLNPSQLRGAWLFRQHCDACHGPNMSSATSFGPRLSRDNLKDREDFIRNQIAEGSVNMPAFKYAFNAAQIKDLMEYLKKVEPYCMTSANCKPGDVRRAAAVSQ